jgi:hypothetical protein
LGAETRNTVWALSTRSNGAVDPGYLRLLPAGPAPRESPEPTACAYGEQVRAAGILERCERDHPTRGVLDLKTRIPGGPAVTDPHPRITHDFGGELAATPFGRCVADGLTALAERFEVPSNLRNGLVSHSELQLPGVEKIWPRQSRNCPDLPAR